MKQGLLTIRRAHRRLVDAIARRTGLTGGALRLPNRPPHNHAFGNPGAGRRLPTPHHDPARRRVLVDWQGRIEVWLRGRPS
ncbi:MAG: hypothetical protein ACREQM_10445 [Candidatus Dormibacteraceae bacterium]